MEVCDESGFTILETLVALTISSILAIAIFQSTLQFNSVTVRAERLLIDLGNRQSDRVALDEVTSHFLPDPVVKFQGLKTTFSGLTTPFLTNQEVSGLVVVAIRSDGLQLRQGTGDWIWLAEAEATDQFSYLGTDGVLRDHWPPEKAIPFSPLADPLFGDHIFKEPPNLPVLLVLKREKGDDVIADFPLRNLDIQLPLAGLGELE